MKSGFITIVGRPNAGKSTLLNKILGEKIAAVSNKPQTTRNSITGIVTENDCQMVFIDTPGIHNPKTKLGKFMIKEIDESVKSVDVLVFVVDVNDRLEENFKIVENIKNQDVPMILVINKVDTGAKENILGVISALSEKADFEEIIPISAKFGDGVELVVEEIKKRLPDGPMYFPDDMITDQPEKQIASEIIREKALWCLDKEVPHGIAVDIEAFKEQENGVIKITAAIYCEKKSHKGIVIGKNGTMLKKIGQLAREDIERFLDAKVYLDLWVKIKEDWRNSDFMLKNFGFNKQD